MKPLFIIFLALVLIPIWALPTRGEPGDIQGSPHVPILLYHRFGPVVADSMTVTTRHFESQLKYFRDNGYTVIRLRQLVDNYLGKGGTIPSRSLVIVVDDGHKSVYTDMLPLVKQYQVPVTLFLYPSALSNASYAMTWDQLKELKETGLFDFQSHTYWHPNFKKEKRKLDPAQYESLVEMQLRKSKETVERRLDVKVDMLAWPFGIYDDDLLSRAAEAGYIAGFTLERRDASRSENIMALPRYLVVDKAGETGANLASKSRQSGKGQISSILR